MNDEQRIKWNKYQKERYHRLHPTAKYLGEGITDAQKEALEYIRVKKWTVEQLEEMAAGLPPSKRNK